MWYWAFNGDNDIYTMCWEAYVDVEGEPTNIESGETDTSDSNDGGSSSEYLVTIPICYDGANYNEEVLTSAALSLFSDLEWDIVNINEGNSEFNATLQTHTQDSPADITEAASNDDHQFCDQIMIEFGDDGSHTCSSCSDVVVYTDGSNLSSGSNDDSDNALVAVIIVFIIVVLIIGAGIGYQKLVENGKGPNGNQRQNAMATQVQTNNTQAISRVQETR